MSQVNGKGVREKRGTQTKAAQSADREEHKHRYAEVVITANQLKFEVTACIPLAEYNKLGVCGSSDVQSFVRLERNWKPVEDKFAPKISLSSASQDGKEQLALSIGQQEGYSKANITIDISKTRAYPTKETFNKLPQADGNVSSDDSGDEEGEKKEGEKREFTVDFFVHVKSSYTKTCKCGPPKKAMRFPATTRS